MIFSFFLINKVSAATSDTYDMSSWIDISEFTLPSGINTEEYNIVIWLKNETLGYRLLTWKKDEDKYLRIFPSSSGFVFPNVHDIYANDWNKTRLVYISYYDETAAFSKVFNSSVKTSRTFVAEKIIYTNTNIYDYSGYGQDKWFDLDLVNFEPTSYEFNEDIDVTDISKIKINFELPEDTSNLGLELDYSVKVLESSNYEGVIGQPHIILKSLDENNNPLTDVLSSSYLTKDIIISNMCSIADCKQYKEYKTNPFEEMITDITMEKVDLFLNNYGSSFFGQWDDFKELAQKLIDEDYCTDLYYFDNLNMSLLPDSTVYGYSLEIDTINYEGSLNLNFISNLNYSIEYEYEEENEDYYVMIKMQNRAALVLIPKVYDMNNSISSSFLSDIYLYGTYDIELWEDLDTKNVFDRHNNYSNGVYSHYFDWHYQSSVLYIINKDINSDFTFIRFDSRYYNYVIKNYLNDEVTITNPNTGEDMTIPDISDLYKYDSPTDSRFAFNSFLKPIKFIFESITNFYNNYCPEIVQYFFYLIFAFFVILVLIKIFL